MLPSDCEDRHYPTRLVPHYGQAAVADSRWPRWDLECPVARLLEDGISASLFGLRRIGKSSLTVGIEELLREQGLVPVVVELQGANRIEDLVRRLVDACGKAGERPLLDGLRQVYAETRAWMPAALRTGFALAFGQDAGHRERPADPNAALDYVEVALGPLAERLRANERRIVLILDELPFFCQNLLGAGGAQARQVGAFLAELRRWRREGLTMLVCGSIGVHRLERDWELDPNLFGDLKHEKLPPLAPSQAAAMVAALARGCGLAGWTGEHTAAVLAAPPAAYPAFFQDAFIDLRRTGAGPAPSPEQTGERARAAAYQLMQENFARQFDHRLRYYAPPEPDVALAIFRRLAAADAPVPAAELAGAFPDDWPPARRSALMSALIEDDFLCRHPGQRFAFATPLVAAWWAERVAWGG